MGAEEESIARSDREWTLKELENLKDKYCWTVINRNVYNIKCWMHAHPGGDLVLQHMLYKDATEEYRAYHPEYVTKQLLPKYCIGKLKESEIVLTDTSFSNDYKRLVATLQEKRFFETNYMFYVLEMIKCFSLFLISIWIILFVNIEYHSTIIYCIAAFFMAFFWQQMAFVGHDLGHNGVTANNKVDHVLGVLLANYLGAISMGWWKDSHNTHHIVTNDPIHDPDIQHLPFLAVTRRFFDSVYSTYHRRILKFDAFAKVMVAIQHKLYYVIMFLGKFNLLAQSVIFLTINKRARLVVFELSGLIFFLVWYSYLVSYINGGFNRFLFVFLSSGITSLLHVQITISHFSMDTTERPADEEFFKHQLRTTMDVDCSPWMDWLHGGLQFQIVHHLFPRMPRPNYRAASKYVLDFCLKHNISYTKFDFIESNKVIINHLEKVANQVKDKSN